MSWQKRLVSNKDEIPLTTGVMNGVIADAQQRLDALGALVMRHVELQKKIADDISLVEIIRNEKKGLKALFATVIEEALFGIHTDHVGEHKTMSKIMDVRLPTTLGELQQRLDKGWNALLNNHIESYDELGENGKVFASDMFTCLVDEICEGAHWRIGDQRVRGVE